MAYLAILSRARPSGQGSDRSKRRGRCNHARRHGCRQWIYSRLSQSHTPCIGRCILRRGNSRGSRLVALELWTKSMDEAVLRGHVLQVLILVYFASSFPRILMANTALTGDVPAEQRPSSRHTQRKSFPCTRRRLEESFPDLRSASEPIRMDQRTDHAHD